LNFGDNMGEGAGIVISKIEVGNEVGAREFGER
jgi:hypothetical protein